MRPNHSAVFVFFGVIPAPVSALSSILLLLLAAGCSNPEMKGTPFYTGEYGKRRGPAEQRVNAWPLVYYRAPALSVAWPIFELTDDHTAVRPFFSMYGLDETNREYNVLWPLAQFERPAGDNHIFPLFWGEDHRVLFPVYWHYGQPWGEKGGSDSLFPLWVFRRHSTNDLDFYALWPVVHRWSEKKRAETGSMVLPLYWHQRNEHGSQLYSLPWLSSTSTNGDSWRLLLPLYYQASNQTSVSFATPLWAQGRSDTKDWRAVIPLCYWDEKRRTLISSLWAYWRKDDTETWLAPWALSWQTRRPERHDLWLGGGLAHASWGPQSGSHYFLPLYYRHAAHHTLLTPLVGWQHGTGDYFYPFTPLAGVRTDQHHGSWVFPLYSHSRAEETGHVRDRFLLLGGHDHTKADRHSWFFPLFSFHDRGPLDSDPGPTRYATYGKEFLSMPLCWYENQCVVRPNVRHFESSPQRAARSSVAAQAAGPAATNGATVREYRFKHGTFPLWHYRAISTPALGQSEVAGSVGLLLYNYKHQLTPAPPKLSAVTNDYTRARILWRLWHYERLNGNVSVDVFPTLTYDHQTDGFKKVSFLWRFFRYQHATDGARQLDIIFIPVRRTAPDAQRASRE